MSRVGTWVVENARGRAQTVPYHLVIDAKSSVATIDQQIEAKGCHLVKRALVLVRRAFKATTSTGAAAVWGMVEVDVVHRGSTARATMPWSRVTTSKEGA